jgi:hypothetical protein
MIDRSVHKEPHKVVLSVTNIGGDLALTDLTAQSTGRRTVDEFAIACVTFLAGHLTRQADEGGSNKKRKRQDRGVPLAVTEFAAEMAMLLNLGGEGTRPRVNSAVVQAERVKLRSLRDSGRDQEVGMFCVQ